MTNIVIIIAIPREARYMYKLSSRKKWSQFLSWQRASFEPSGLTPKNHETSRLLPHCLCCQLS